MCEARQVRIGRDAQGNAIVTGDDNQVYVFLGPGALPPEIRARLESGALRPADAPGAVPLPTLTLTIAAAPAAAPAGDAAAWTVTARSPTAAGEPRTVPVPWQAEAGFAAALEGFWTLSRRHGLDEAEARALHAQARLLGEALRAVLAPEEVRTLTGGARRDGPPPMLVIESDDDRVLALPWELLRLGDGMGDGMGGGAGSGYAVHDGRLDVARCVPAAGAPALDPPAAPVTLAVTVAAPQGSGLAYEAESYYITRALHDHVGLVVNEMGEVDDLVAALCRPPHPIGVHFSGHGRPGELLFEDEFGDPRPVPVDALLREIRRAAPERFPRFVYLACCHGGDPAGTGAGQRGIASTAAALHREGVAQVVAYFGPVYDSQSTWAEAAFYREIAAGRRSRDAVRAARLAMTRPLIPAVKESLRDAAGPGPSGMAASGIAAFGWAQLAFYHRGPDHPLGLPVPAKYAGTLEAPPAREEEPVLFAGRSRLLRTGFVGRRTELHALRRSLKAGQPIHVVQGLGGLGKSTFCEEALKVYRRLGWDALILWCAEVEQDPDPAGSLLRQLAAAAEERYGAR